MLGSLFNVAKDVATVVTAPVEIALDVTSAATKVVAEGVKDLVDDVKEEFTDEHEPK